MKEFLSKVQELIQEEIGFEIPNPLQRRLCHKLFKIEKIQTCLIIEIVSTTDIKGQSLLEKYNLVSTVTLTFHTTEENKPRFTNYLEE